MKLVVPDKPYIPRERVEKFKSEKLSIEIYDDFPQNENELLERIKDSDYILVDPSNKFYTKKVLINCPNLKVIITTSVGVSHIDTKFCTENNIKVINFPGYNSNSVAEFAFGLLLSATRNIVKSNKELLNGFWREAQNLSGVELGGKSLGIIGGGNISKRLIELSKAFNMNTFVWNRTQSDEKKEYLGIDSFYNLYEVAEKSDFVIIAVALTDQTKHLISKEFLSVMKKNSFLINVSRGEVVNTLELAKAVLEKRISGAAIDVIENEPLDVKKSEKIIIDFINHPNVIITPHIGGSSAEADERLFNRIEEIIIGIIKNSI